MPNTLQEFLNENMHRNYPIMDSGDARDVTGQYNLPTELIADINLIVPDGVISTGTFFISSVVIRRYTIDVEMSYKPDTASSVVIGWFHNMDTSSEAFLDYTFVSIPQADPLYTEFEDVVGTMVAGVGLAAITFPGTWSFDENNTPIVPTAISEQLTKFRSLQVGNDIFTGNIILKEGDNVTISPSYDALTNTTTITISAQEITTTGVSINSDEDILAALTSIYGQPIVRINEIPPQNTGDFYLAGSDCIVVGPESSGIRITNPCGQPCCDKETYLSAVYDSINQLNSRHVRLEDFLRGTVDNTDVLISRLKDMENSIGLGGF